MGGSDYDHGVRLATLSVADFRRFPDVRRPCVVMTGKDEGMSEQPGTDPVPGMDPDEPIPDTPAELDEPDALPAPPVEATPDDPGGDPSGDPAPA